MRVNLDHPAHLHEAWPRLLLCLVVAALLGACAQRPPASVTVQGHKPQVVPVLGFMPMSQPQAKTACASDGAAAASAPPDSGSGAPPDTGFCVWYEYQGQNFTVVLPNEPGETLTLQIPILAPAPMVGSPMAVAPLGVAPIGVAPIGVAPYPLFYPGVYFYGGYYRPRAYAPHLAPPIPPRAWTRPPGRHRRPGH